ncbi:hypothetical protein KY329_04540 [Candidatus Woesearchaeota archaeon]|nr:hypothetical protein [Candidatus Woesearchaeota archaeon]
MERVLIDKKSKKILYTHLKKKYCARSLIDLSTKLGISHHTLDNWFYQEKRYLPSSIIPSEVHSKLTVLDKQPENWGKKLGGQRTYALILKKLSKEELLKRQKKGGMQRAKQLDLLRKKSLCVDIKDPIFLEFYGALLGDGWLSINKNKGRTQWWVGLCGHSKKDREYLMHIKKIMENLFHRKVTVKTKEEKNCTELIMCHKHLVNFLHKKYGFPIGRKTNLVLPETCNNWQSAKHAIRGVFDTDGSLYFDKTPAGNPYPVISIHMNAPLLLCQIKSQLLRQGFKVRFRKNEIILKGNKQIQKWMKEIGSRNPKHFLKLSKNHE